MNSESGFIFSSPFKIEYTEFNTDMLPLNWDAVDYERGRF